MPHELRKRDARASADHRSPRSSIAAAATIATTVVMLMMSPQAGAGSATWSSCGSSVTGSISGSSLAQQNNNHLPANSPFCEVDDTSQISGSGGTYQSATDWWTHAVSGATLKTEYTINNGELSHFGTGSVVAHASAQQQYISGLGWTGSFNANADAGTTWTAFFQVDAPTEFEFTGMVRGEANDLFTFDVVSGPDAGLVLSQSVGGGGRSDVAGTLYPSNWYRLRASLGVVAQARVTTGTTNVVSDATVDWDYRLTLNPLPDTSPLIGLSLGLAEVAGCKSVTGKVTLSAPAPTGGTIVTLADTLASAATPASVTVPAGTTTKSFSIKTVPVSGSESGTVSATLGATTLNKALTVRPIGIQSTTLTPATVVGGNPVTGKATLECNAGPGAILVDLASSNPAVASPIAANVVVPQGANSATFDVTTNPVLAKTTATISASANGVAKSKKLTVNVAAAVSPASLRFGSAPVGQTSAPMNATLTNKGAVAFSVSSIILTGTYASWFAQTNDCPASLDPGASCTIGVTFTPASAASKSAKLSISTSATSAPLSVSLSGTGL